jgi:putative transposase
MIRSHKIRLNPTLEQAVHFEKTAHVQRFVFNWGLEQWNNQYRAGGKPNAMTLKKQFNGLRLRLFPWTYEVTKCAVEGAFINLAKAFERFFEGHKKGYSVGYPKFKSRKRKRLSFYVANDKFKVSGYEIKLPKVGWVNMTETLRFEGKIIKATVSKMAQWWFVSITVELKEGEKASHKGQSVGIDLGLNRLATLSDGYKFENQKPLRRLLKKVKRFNRQMSRKQSESQNRVKARSKLAKLHQRISHQREDWLQKLTTHVTSEYAFIGIEDLHVKGMLKNRRLALSLSDASFGRLLVLLKEKAQATGTVVIEVGRFYPSSQLCHVCGTQHRELTLADRIFVCPNLNCGLVCDRDWNASVNILRESLRLYRAG